MKHYRKELWFETATRRAFVNITPTVEEALEKSGIREGLLLCNAMHITSSVFINDDETGLHQDFEVCNAIVKTTNRRLGKHPPHDTLAV